jgi:hypothetical protein
VAHRSCRAETRLTTAIGLSAGDRYRWIGTIRARYPTAPICRMHWFEGSVSREAVRTEQAAAVQMSHEARKTATEADLLALDLELKRSELVYRAKIHSIVSETAGPAGVDPALLDRLIDREVFPALRKLGEAEITALEPGETESEV